MEEEIKQNKIIFNGEEKTWNYKICPCLECPIYPNRKDWEDEKDIRKNKCWSSRCTYDKIKAKEVTDFIYYCQNYYHCIDCDKWFPKHDFFEPICPECHQDMS